MKKKTTIVWLSRNCSLINGHELSSIGNDIDMWRHEPDMELSESMDIGDAFQDVAFGKGDHLRWFCQNGFKLFTGIDVERGDVFECEVIQTKKGFEFNVLEEWSYIYDE